MRLTRQCNFVRGRPRSQLKRRPKLHLACRSTQLTMQPLLAHCCVGQRSAKLMKFYRVPRLSHLELSLELALAPCRLGAFQVQLRSEDIAQADGNELGLEMWVTC